uniref:Uncharacterized protein n=1 Tax=Sphaerodactylus townsendi TaxID=933632 RepID=A0ACB8EAR0_9SAUR
MVAFSMVACRIAIADPRRQLAWITYFPGPCTHCFSTYAGGEFHHPDRSSEFTGPNCSYHKAVRKRTIITQLNLLNTDGVGKLKFQRKATPLLPSYATFSPCLVFNPNVTNSFNLSSPT